MPEVNQPSRQEGRSRVPVVPAVRLAVVALGAIVTAARCREPQMFAADVVLLVPAAALAWGRTDSETFLSTFRGGWTPSWPP